MEIKNYSVYANEPYPHFFGKLYKGVIVVVDNDGDDYHYCHFAIRTKKAKQTIFKTRYEKLINLVFDDLTHTVSCEFENTPKNKCPKSLTFDEEVYNELKENIPVFMEKCGCIFTSSVTDNVMKLVF